eukprot:6186451-Pleurochrysis_carterae.AAC.3
MYDLSPFLIRETIAGHIASDSRTKGDEAKDGEHKMGQLCRAGRSSVPCASGAHVRCARSKSSVDELGIAAGRSRCLWTAVPDTGRSSDLLQ